MAKSTHTLGATGGTRTHEWRLGLFLILLLANLPDSHFFNGRNKVIQAVQKHQCKDLTTLISKW